MAAVKSPAVNTLKKKLPKTVTKKLRDKSYRLTDNKSGEASIQKAGIGGSLTVLGEVKGKQVRRAIRHCPNQPSIYIDEQDAHALIEPIIFINGHLHVKANQPITQEFLDMSPDNVANGGTRFEFINDEMEASESIVDEELKTDVRMMIREVAKEDGGIDKLSAVVAVLKGSVQEASRMLVGELKRILYNEVDANVSYFVNDVGDVTIFDDEDIQRKYMTLKAINDGIIKKSPTGKTMLWAKDNTAICTAPASINLTDFFASYLASDDGMLVVQEIVNRS